MVCINLCSRAVTIVDKCLQAEAIFRQECLSTETATGLGCQDNDQLCCCAATDGEFFFFSKFFIQCICNKL